MSLTLIFCGILLLPLWKKTRRFLVGVSCHKKWLLTNFVFFILLKLKFFFRNHAISSIFSYVNILVHASAVFAKHWHVPTEGPINKNFCYCGTTNFWRKIVMPALGFVFRIHTLSETSKNPPQYIFAGDKSFRQLSAMPLTCFVQHKFFAHWPKENENFAKFQTAVSSNCSCGHVERNFDIFARNFIQEAEFFLFSVQTCWRKNLFFLESSSQMVLPDR